MTRNRPTLAVVMIVKNEAHGIARTLDSLRQDADRFYILDTGSEDRTLSVAAEWLQEWAQKDGGRNYFLGNASFVDFATTRNQALEGAANKQPCDWYLTVDADDLLVTPGSLREELAALDAGTPAFQVMRRLGQSVWPMPLGIRHDSPWRFQGSVHEVLMGPGEAPVLDVILRHDRPPQSEEQSRARWERDKVLLTDEIADHIIDSRRDNQPTRAMFYLGQTEECLGNYKEALTCYEQRVLMVGGYQQERYLAALRAGHLVSKTEGYEPRRSAVDWWLLAADIDPDRPEAWFQLMAHLNAEKAFRVSLTFALPLTAAINNALGDRLADRMFLDMQVVHVLGWDAMAVCCHYLGRTEEAVRFGARALLAAPDDARLQRNMQFYSAAVAP